MLLLLATVGLWVETTWQGRTVGRINSNEQRFFVASYHGTVVIHHEAWSHIVFDPGAERPAWYSGRFSWNPPPSGWFDFEFVVDELGFRVHVPHWFLTFIFFIGPAFWYIKWRIRQKQATGKCPSCGYDLTGNESGVCPECGEETANVKYGKMEPSR